MATNYKPVQRKSKDEKNNGKKVHIVPGHCLIINNSNFDRSKSIPCGNVNEAVLTRIFQPLGFKVDVQRDLTKLQMIEVLEKYRKVEHAGCFVVIILSHEQNGVIFSRDDQEISVEDEVVERFHKSKCPSLQEHCSIIITLAHTSQRERVIYIGGNDPTVKQITTENPEMTDIAMVYATTSFYPAAVNEVSPFIQLFEDAMSTGVENNEDFSIIITKVKNQLEAKSPTCALEFNTGFTKQCYFLWIGEVEEARKLQKEFQRCLYEWKEEREKTIKMFRDIAQNLEEHRKNVNISRIAGSTAGVGGVGLFVLGAALAPITFGASAALMITGGAIVGVGGLTASGASITDRFLSNSRLNEAQEQIEHDNGKLSVLQMIQVRVTQQTKKISEKFPGFKDEDIAKVTGMFSSISVEVKSAEIGAINDGYIVLRSLTAIINIVEIVRSGRDIHKRTKSEAVKELHRKADELEENKKEICRQMGLFENTIDACH